MEGEDTHVSERKGTVCSVQRYAHKRSPISGCSLPNIRNVLNWGKVAALKKSANLSNLKDFFSASATYDSTTEMFNCTVYFQNV